MTDGSRVLVSVRVAASPARAFTVFTEQIGQWWRHNGLFQSAPDGRARFPSIPDRPVV